MTSKAVISKHTPKSHDTSAERQQQAQRTEKESFAIQVPRRDCDRKPLLLHACCGPCSLEPLRLLRDEGFEPTICWTNPNIQPLSEWQRRLDTLQTWAAQVAHVHVVIAKDDRARWEQSVAPAAFDRERRCRACYALRITEACRIAQDLGFTYVSTTLAVSPYQLFDLCGKILTSTAKAHGLTAIWRDYRSHYPDATRHSRELGMYRQNYCGCRFSAAEAALERQERRDTRKAQRVQRAMVLQA